MITSRLAIVGLMSLGSLACSGSGSTQPAGPAGVDSGSDAGGDAGSDAPGVDAADDVSSADIAADAPAEVALSFPQALAGAMLANPDVYPELPLRIAVEGAPESIEISLSGATASAADPDGDGTWEAALPIGSQVDGVVALTATAMVEGIEVASAVADLRISREGVQITDYATAGAAGTPRLHRIGQKAWLTWTDRSTGSPDAWLQEVDGAGRLLGDRVSLIGATTNPALYARTIPGFNYMGVLYQSLALPYRTHFRVVGLLGNPVVDTIDLDPPDTDASFGGDIAFDGTAFIVVWRVADAAGVSRILWQRISPSDGQVTGPVVVAESGNDDPEGGFDPFSFVKVAAIGTVSMVTFVRARRIPLLDMSVPKAQVARVTQSGTLEATWYLGGETDFTWHREARVARVGSSFLLLWSSVDLNDPSTNPPNLFQALSADSSGEPPAGPPVTVFDAVDDRDEPFALAHPEHFGTLAWLDHRAYTEDPGNGRIELYTAPLGNDLTADTPTVFPHARFVAGLAQLNGAPMGTNVMLTWIDERHGGGIADPKPEVWLETVWY